MNITGFPKEENTITTPTKYIDKNNTTNTNINNNNSSSSSKNKKKHSSSHKKKKKKKRKVEKTQAELYRERKEREYEANGVILGGILWIYIIIYIYKLVHMYIL